MFDVAIVGLGAMGSAAAWQAAKRGARVIGIDQFRPPHALGSSHGDTRITRLAIGEGEQYTPLVMRANEIWREIERESGEKLYVVTGGLIISGPRSATTHVAGFFDNTVAAARRFAIEHEVLDAAQIRRRFPQFAVRDEEVGYFEPGAGYLHPERCIAAQLKLAAARGAELHTDERVLAVEDKGGRVAITTDRGTYEAKQAILSMGAWLPAFLGPDPSRPLKVTRQVLYWFMPRGDIAEFEAPRLPIWIWELQDSHCGIYGFPSIDGSVKVATEQYAQATTPESVDREVSDEEKRAMYRDLLAPNVPGLSGKCVKATTCMYTSTPDSQFWIDRDPRRPNVVIVSACSGHGFKHSAAIGEKVAGMTFQDV